MTTRLPPSREEQLRFKRCLKILKTPIEMTLMSKSSSRPSRYLQSHLKRALLQLQIKEAPSEFTRRLGDWEN